MRVSAKAEYACRAVLELSRCHKNTDVIQINEIAARQVIPRKYLVQILLQLQRSGLVKSKRGASGGYMLAKAPADITLGDVVRTMDGSLMAIESLEGKVNGSNNRQGSGHHVLKEIWREVQDQLGFIMDGITFEEICKRADKSSSMYHI